MELNFQANKYQNDVSLTWQTNRETDTDRFEIEKSLDGGIVYKKISEVASAGTSISIKNYQYTDLNAAANALLKTIYYRLKHIDLDGKYTYSPIRSIKFEDKIYGLQAYPNPAKDFIKIQINNIEEALSYNIVDQIGKKALNGTIRNSNSTSINIASLSSGIYFIQVGEFNKETIKFVKH